MPVGLQEIIAFLERLAPLDVAEEWDNVGLLVGDEDLAVKKVLTCLTLTSDVAEEAIAEQVNLIISHHPVLFRGVRKVTSATGEGEVLLRLIQKNIAVYSPHTAFDGGHGGINQQLAELLELDQIAPLRPSQNNAEIGGGRYGTLAEETSLAGLLSVVRERLQTPILQFAGDAGQRVSRVAVACGSAADFIEDADRLDCDVLLTGEARFHACLDARERGIGLILAGHFATERPGVVRLAEILRETFPTLPVQASRQECDPVLWSLG